MQRIFSWNGDSAWWHWSYLGDWLVTVVVTAVIGMATTFLKPFCKYIPPGSSSLGYPYAEHETIPGWTLPLISWVCPIIVAVACLVGQIRKNTPSLRHHLHHIVLCITQACCIAILVTEPAKLVAGRNRPDFISRLERAHIYNATDFSLKGCPTDDKMVLDGMKSFPSGHSSLIFAGWTSVSLFLTIRLHLLPRFFILSACTIFPFFVAISRTRDYRHNYSDVLAGSLIGITAGLLAFSMHFSLVERIAFNRKIGLASAEERLPLAAQHVQEIEDP